MIVTELPGASVTVLGRRLAVTWGTSIATGTSGAVGAPRSVHWLKWVMVAVAVFVAGSMVVKTVSHSPDGLRKAIFTVVSSVIPAACSSASVYVNFMVPFILEIEADGSMLVTLVKIPVVPGGSGARFVGGVGMFFGMIITDSESEETSELSWISSPHGGFMGKGVLGVILEGETGGGVYCTMVTPLGAIPN